jgi:hypothetical protein
MWARVVAKLFALFGFYVIVLARMAGQNGRGSYAPGMLELAAVTVLFIIAAVFILTRRPRARPPVE